MGIVFPLIPNVLLLCPLLTSHHYLYWKSGRWFMVLLLTGLHGRSYSCLKPLCPHYLAVVGVSGTLVTCLIMHLFCRRCNCDPWRLEPCVIVPPNLQSPPPSPAPPHTFLCPYPLVYGVPPLWVPQVSMSLNFMCSPSVTLPPGNTTSLLPRVAGFPCSSGASS